jgi:hypothetical protein
MLLSLLLCLLLLLLTLGLLPLTRCALGNMNAPLRLPLCVWHCEH